MTVEQDGAEIPEELGEVLPSPLVSSGDVSALAQMLEESCSPIGLLSPKSSENREIRGRLVAGLIWLLASVDVLAWALSSGGTRWASE